MTRLTGLSFQDELAVRVKDGIITLLAFGEIFDADQLVWLRSMFSDAQYHQGSGHEAENKLCVALMEYCDSKLSS